jgi:hypothetical protein
MTYSDPTERAALIGGFRALADYLESNPEVPAPRYPVVYTFPPDGDWPAMRAEISTVAALFGVIARETSGGHYVAARFFGPVEYRAVAIPPCNDSNSEQSE